MADGLAPGPGPHGNPVRHKEITGHGRCRGSGGRERPAHAARRAPGGRRHQDHVVARREDDSGAVAHDRSPLGTGAPVGRADSARSVRTPLWTGKRIYATDASTLSNARVSSVAVSVVALTK